MVVSKLIINTIIAEQFLQMLQQVVLGQLQYYFPYIQECLLLGLFC